MLKGKRIVVTGSSSGVGWGIAQAFAKEGCHVMLHGIEEETQVASLKQEIESLSKGKATYLQADLSQSKACRALIQKTIEVFGGVDIVVNNAGIQYTEVVEKFPEDKWNLILNINLSANFHTTQAALPYMYQQKWGRLIHIASAHGHVGSVHKSAYVAAKHGLVGFSKVVALEAAGTGVTSNTICPGWVLTPLVQKQIEAMAQEKNLSIEEAKSALLLEKQPSGEFATPEALGGLAVFLATEHGNQVTGASFLMDGGWTAR
jgi:3-hydroxybutyrate dehydrogenase